MSTTTKRDEENRANYLRIIADQFGVDPGDLDAAAVERLSTLTLKDLAMEILPSGELEGDNPFSNAASDFPSPIASQRAEQLEAEGGKTTDAGKMTTQQDGEDPIDLEEVAELSSEEQILALVELGVNEGVEAVEDIDADDEGIPGDVISAALRILENTEGDTLDELFANLWPEDDVLPLTNRMVEEQLKRLSDAYRRGGMAAVVNVDAHPKVRAAFIESKGEETNGGAAANYAAQTGARATPSTSSDADSYPALSAQERAKELEAEERSSRDTDGFPSPVANERAKELERED